MTARLYPVDAVSGAPSYTGRSLRQTLSPLVPGATSARPLGAQSGVRPGTPSTTVSVASSTYTVTPFAGILDVETAAAAGPYAFAFDANVTGSVNAAHATYTRWDGIYVRLSDPAESDGTSTPGVAIVYVAGTASASPAMPTQPARSLLLAKIVVPQSGGGSASVVWMAPTILTGPPSYASLADLQLRNSTAPVAAHGVVGSGTSMAEYLFDGSSWRPAPITPRGGSCTLVSGTYGGGTAVGLENPVGNMIVSNNWLICPEDGYYMVTWTHRITAQSGSIFPGLYRLRSGVSSNSGVLGDLLVTSGEVVTMPPAVVSLLAGDGLRPYLGSAGGTVAGGSARGYFTATRVA